MERVWSTDLLTHAGQPVRLAGWLHRYRQLAHVGFLVLRDARGLVQVVVDDPATARLLGGLANESVLSVTGHAVANPQAPGGAELHGPAVTVLSEAVAAAVRSVPSDPGGAAADDPGPRAGRPAPPGRPGAASARGGADRGIPGSADG